MSFLTLLADAGQTITSGAQAACSSGACNTGLTTTHLFTNIAHVLTGLVGAFSVIMVIVGGLKYVLSNGDAKAVAGAKATILYAVVGVVLSVAAYAIISFVTKSL